MLKIYLAGPEVFSPNVLNIRNQKLNICKKYGFDGIFPFDEILPNLPKKELGLYIGRVNKLKIAASDGVIANITPFRGVSADVGTVYEIGYADGLGIPVFAYSNSSTLYSERNFEVFNSNLDTNGWLIEDFDLIDNLMIDTAVLDSTNTLIYSAGTIADLVNFELTVQSARKFFKN
jgi:nucleoside 2-deoxyribosyltransferase